MSSELEDEVVGEHGPPKEDDLRVQVPVARRLLFGCCRGSVSEKHLPAYLKELAFRFNRRFDKTVGPIMTVVGLFLDTPPFPYAGIVEKDRAARPVLRLYRVRRRVGVTSRPPPRFDMGGAGDRCATS
jgi:hypothetical protein